MQKPCLEVRDRARRWHPHATGKGSELASMFLLHSTVPCGQTHCFDLKAVTKKGKSWWRKHNAAKYFSDVCIDRDSLVRDFSPNHASNSGAPWSSSLPSRLSATCTLSESSMLTVNLRRGHTLSRCGTPMSPSLHRC
ncbi:hypothetical protein H5410_016117 [Solanum commersonii]|uniref:Uncharacterized protein n=1 Tax=Solanum commersonii TaxID=4109 RepID=A0A9J5ZVD0_SOLCO|nr:hypothetical protein H5410_016117 [Solanum commersonii]